MPVRVLSTTDDAGVTTPQWTKNLLCDCTGAACRGECNQNEVLVIGYCGPRRIPVTVINERTATCPRVAAANPLVMVCVKAGS